jgi:hypothetical protein
MGGDCKMNKQVYVCDVCGAERKEANHWFLAESSPVSTSINFLEWDYSDGIHRDISGVKHICGQVCAHKLLDEFLSK